jgi:hypothetical protein
MERGILARFYVQAAGFASFPYSEPRTARRSAA